jgi:cyclophilin family peptidyl-prolyl cis-trans isomerase
MYSSFLALIGQFVRRRSLRRATRYNRYRPSFRHSRSNRYLTLENLQTRSLLAADTWSLLPANDGADAATSGHLFLAGRDQAAGVAGQAEGEAAADLVGFAKALTQAGVKIFGADWSVNTSNQLRLFQDGAAYLDYVEVTQGDRSLNPIGVQQQISVFPTWEMADGTRLEGIQTLNQLAAASSVPVPQSSVPSLRPIPSQTLLRGSPLHLPIDAYDPDGQPLLISVSSSQPSLVEALILEGNSSALIRMQDFGDMVFQLFDKEAARPVQRFSQLAEAGFYNTTSTATMSFHRVLSGFVIQGGDPLGNGTGGSSLGRFDDQFNLNLQHNRSGVLSYAKTSDDTNDSQFFITDGPTRHLDFNHSIFGQLIEGEPTRLAIERTAVVNPTIGNPVRPVVIEAVSIFRDQENGLVRLIAKGPSGSQAEITVTIVDSQGNTASQTFSVTVADDNANGGPFLNDVTFVQQTINQIVDIQLSSQDKENDSREYLWGIPNDEPLNYQGAIDPASGLLQLLPPENFAGEFDVLVAVRQTNPATTTSDKLDIQRIRVQIGSPLTATLARSAVLEGASSTSVTVSRQSIDFSQPLVLSVTSTDSTQLSTPTSVTIPAGQASVSFPVSAIDDTVVDGSRKVELRISAVGFLTKTLTVDVIDKDGPNPWHNTLLAADADRDGALFPVDVLVVINFLNRSGTGVLPIPNGSVSFLIDADNDFIISPVDVLVVINALNRRSGGEGEVQYPSGSIEDSALALYLTEELARLKPRRGGR